MDDEIESILYIGREVSGAPGPVYLSAAAELATV
jgi:hypothetical protein